MKISRYPVVISAVVLLGVAGLSSCSSDNTATSVSLAPTTEATSASPTDPVSTAAPTSTAGKETPETGTPSTESVIIELDADAGMAEEASVVLGTPVTIRVIAEVEDEFHLHGYDIELSGDDVTFEFVADKLGEFELEGHESGEVLLNLSVVAGRQIQQHFNSLLTSDGKAGRGVNHTPQRQQVRSIQGQPKVQSMTGARRRAELLPFHQR